MITPRDNEGYDAYDDIEDKEEDEFESFDCHMDRHGACGKAGSEECEFECPYRKLQDITN
jgi:hypothetical protein